MKLNIDILCLPCIKCRNLKNNIERALRISEAEATIRHIVDFSEFTKHSVNVSQAPILVIEGRVEFAGRVPPIDLLSKRISEIKSGGTIF